MERKYARRRYLASVEFRNLIEEIGPYIEALPHALIGGLAVSYYANPPVTVDVDFLVEASIGEIVNQIRPLREKGWSAGEMIFTDRRKGFPRRGISLRRRPRMIVDLLATGEDEYLQSIVHRAKLTEVQDGVPLLVISPEDLIVLKSLAGRDKDVEDVVSLTSTLGEKLDREYIDQKIDELM